MDVPSDPDRNVRGLSLSMSPEGDSRRWRQGGGKAVVPGMGKGETGAAGPEGLANRS
jgi:hypothetical protein